MSPPDSNGGGGELAFTGELKPGDVVRGAQDYAIEKWLGRGGHATVYEARNAIGKRVVIKIIHRHLAQRADLVERFLKEARVLASLEHPNIVEVYSAGQTKESRPQVYIEMQPLTGESGRTLIRGRKTLGLEATVDVLTELAGALAAAHGAEVIHQDLKLDNVFVHYDKSARRCMMKLLDFGVARMVGDTVPEGTFEGTVEYAAPEQLSGAFPVTHKVDLYALGVIAFELLTGRRPFQDAEDADREAEKLIELLGSDQTDAMSLQVVRAKLQTDAPRLGDHASVPQRLEALVDRMLSRHPGARPASAAEVEEELRSIAQVLANQPRQLTTQAALIASVTSDRAVSSDVAPAPRPRLVRRAPGDPASSRELESAPSVRTMLDGGPPNPGPRQGAPAAGATLIGVVPRTDGGGPLQTVAVEPSASSPVRKPDERAMTLPMTPGRKPDDRGMTLPMAPQADGPLLPRPGRRDSSPPGQGSRAVPTPRPASPTATTFSAKEQAQDVNSDEEPVELPRSRRTSLAVGGVLAGVAVITVSVIALVRGQASLPAAASTSLPTPPAAASVAPSALEAPPKPMTPPLPAPLPAASAQVAAAVEAPVTEVPRPATPTPPSIAKPSAHAAVVMPASAPHASEPARRSEGPASAAPHAAPAPRDDEAADALGDPFAAPAGGGAKPAASKPPSKAK